ncbi:6-phosphogluconolactonase [Paenibacillus pabuli]|uniref:6-phosphogluconolactonase n=1 Tax=Paenibacillus pabuli TaxID=1472 RepID=UPI001FFF4668|nr:6-phosphogluconolactonase [Paenibacillus pabuli]UPK41354.1 6-phosphogluconolactonase [Paenibacillus pabuli]
MIRIFETEENVAAAVAAEMKVHLSDDHAVFCLASGSTPQKSYLTLAEDAGIQAETRHLKIVSLDEWVGVSKEVEGSCYQMLNEDLFSLIQLDPQQIEFFDGTAPDLEEECLRIDCFIEQHPITFSLMGVGMNGHIGLNEPGSPTLSHSSVVDLSPTTRTVAQKYFRQPTRLDKGITLGLGQIAASKRVIVVITGEHKAGVVQDIFTNPDAKLPAQELLGYEHIDFFLDSEAAKYIKE